MGDHRTSSCYGDSGGPLVADTLRRRPPGRRRLARRRRCGVKDPTIYASVADNLDFIDEEGRPSLTASSLLSPWGGSCSQGREEGRQASRLQGFGFCLATAGGASAGAGPNERIVGGDVADPVDWPFIAAVASRSGDQFCGGSVVAEEAVVTAAHCVVGLRPKNVRVITGRPDLNEESDGKEIKVEEISVHREYPRKGHHDIAVLSLKEPAEAPPVLLPTVAEGESETGPGDELRVAGWGGTTPTGGNPSDVLLDVALFAISDAECSTHFSFFRPTEEVCAFGEEIAPDRTTTTTRASETAAGP